MKFRMVDRILQWQPRRAIRGIKTVSFEEYQLKTAFADEPCLPESLVLESLLQLGNWLIVLSSDFSQLGLILRIEEVCWRGRVRPGEQLQMEASVRIYRDDGVVFDGHAATGREVIATGRGCLALPVPLADYSDPEDLRVLFSEIYRPDEPQENPACRG